MHIQGTKLPFHHIPKMLYRPYSEQRHDRYESEAVRDRLTMFTYNDICCKKLNKAPRLLIIFHSLQIGSFLSTEIFWKDIFSSVS